MIFFIQRWLWLSKLNQIRIESSKQQRQRRSEGEQKIYKKYKSNQNSRREIAKFDINLFDTHVLN